MKIIRNGLFILLVLSVSANAQSNCGLFSAGFPWLAQDFVPNSTTTIRTIGIRFIIVQNPNINLIMQDFTYPANFIDNDEEIKLWNDVLDNLNSTYSNLYNDEGCTVPVLNDTRIRFELVGVDYVTDNTVGADIWSMEDAEKCPDILPYGSGKIENQFLKNYTSEINIFFAEEPQHFNHIVYGTAGDPSLKQWCASDVPGGGLPNGSLAPDFATILKINARCSFADFYYDKYQAPNGTLYWDNTETSYHDNNTYWWLANGIGWGLSHELGHCLGLWHVSGCDDFMDPAGDYPPGSSSRTFLSSDEIGLIHKASYLQTTRNYFHWDYDLSNQIAISSPSDNWNYDIRTYNDINVLSGATLTINCKTSIPSGAKIIIESGGKLIISDNAEIDLSPNSYIHVEEGGTLQINNTVAGKGIVFDQSNTNYVLVEGTLDFENGADFILQGRGYYHFLGTPTLTLSTGSDVNFIGNNNNDKMLEIECPPIIVDGKNVTLKTGKIEVHNDTWLSIKNSSVDIDNIKVDGVESIPSSNKGLYIESPVSLCSVHNVKFTDLALGLELNYINQNPGADIFTNTFTNCKTGVKTHSSNNINLTLCT